MSSFMNIARTLLAKIMAFLFSVVSIFSAGLPSGDLTAPEAPEDFTPVIRFAVCSDIHLNGEEGCAEEERLTKLINFMYDYSSEQEYDSFDALVCVGDTMDSGAEAEYDQFNRIIEENLNQDETQLLICTGNHEYITTRDTDASVGARFFEEKIGPLDTNAVINGYHFVLASYDDDGRSFDEKISWMDSEISASIADTGDKPVFVFQHPAPFATIYGSINWGDISVPKVLSKYSQVVDFSGHSHYPINDPRSCWQGNYTAFGCGSLSYFETELDAIAGNFPYEVDQCAQFYIVEADADGNVKVMPYDLITDQFFDNDYYLTDLASGDFDYTYNKMKKRDEAPVFPKNTTTSVDKNEDGESILTFTGATDNYVVESYKVSLTRDGVTVAEDNFSGKYMYLFEEDVYEVNLGVLQPGISYQVSIVALNAYAEASEAYTFRIIGE